ncbi:MAG: ATP-binding protein [Thermoplasmata archaeon]
MTLDDLQKLVRESESSRVELKREVSGDVIKGLSTDIAAIANYEGGHIVFGFTDKEKDPVGCVIQEKDLDSISQQAGNCSPSVTIDFEQIPLGSKDFLVVRVPKSSTLHSDAKDRFPMRTGNITTYLDIAGIEMHMKLRGLLRGETGEMLRAQPEEKRNPIPDSEASTIIAGLGSENPIIRLEALRDLNVLDFRYVLFEREDITNLVRQILDTGSEEEINLILDMIRVISFRGTASEKEAISGWIERIFEIGQSSMSVQVVRRAYDALETAGHQLAADLLIHWVTETDDDRYAALQPQNIVGNIRYHGLDRTVRRALFELLQTEPEATVIGRITEILEAVRRSN